MMTAGVPLLLLIIVCICQSIGAERPMLSEEGLSELEKEGQEQYKMAVEMVSMPQFGNCWKEAVLALKQGCRELDDETHGELALRFSDCFLEMSGLPKHNCQFEDKSCLHNMSQSVFDTYQKFYTHTLSMCYFLYNQVWHAEREKTIARLTKVSKEMSQQLEDSVETQSKMLSDLVSVGNLLSQVQSIVLTIQDPFDKHSIFSTLLFFTAAALSVATISRIRSAAGVVPHLFAVLFFGAAVESALANWLLDDADVWYRYKWYVRWLEILICAVLLSYAAWKYQRYGPENNTLLKIISGKIDRLLINIPYKSKFGQTIGETDTVCSNCKRGNLLTGGITLDKNLFSQKSLLTENYGSKLRNSPAASYTGAVSDSVPRRFSVADSLSKDIRSKSHDYLSRRTTSFLRRSPELSHLKTPAVFSSSVSPVVDTKEPVRPSSPPPPYDNTDSSKRGPKENSPVLTRRDFNTPEREVSSKLELKTAVIQIETLKSQNTPQNRPQTPRRQTPTRRTQHPPEESQRSTPQRTKEYNLRSTPQLGK